MQQCYNRGCAQTFVPEENNDDSCCHHPGVPFFHDAYKGWSCCNKKCIDFTEFLNIKGCILSKHSNVKPKEPENQLKNKIDEKKTIIDVRAPVREAMPRPSIKTPMIKILPTVAPALKKSIDDLKNKIGITLKERTISSGEIPIGTACKNSGCSYSFTDTVSDNNECHFHPGVPIFHEGMKYWSCCQKKTPDFAAFMSQKGCTVGEHKWFKEDGEEKSLTCRYDWHQTASNVIISIYAKQYHYERSKIEVNPIRLSICLVFPEQNNKQFVLDLELRGIINVERTTAHMYGSKVEITMPKTEPGLWAKLDFPRENLPPPQQTVSDFVNSAEGSAADSDDEFNLDDIETLKEGVRIADIS